MKALVNVMEKIRALQGVRSLAWSNVKAIQSLICQYEVFVCLVLEEAVMKSKPKVTNTPDCHSGQRYSSYDLRTMTKKGFEYIITKLGLDIDLRNYKLTRPSEREELINTLIRELYPVVLRGDLDDTDISIEGRAIKKALDFEEEMFREDLDEEEYYEVDDGEDLPESKGPEPIGFWKTRTSTEIERYIDESWKGSEEYEKVLVYLENSYPDKRYKGISTCRFKACGARLGSCDMVTSDEKWVFPEGYEHYLIEHGVKPNNPDFIRDAVKFAEIVIEGGTKPKKLLYKKKKPVSNTEQLAEEEVFEAIVDIIDDLDEDEDLFGQVIIPKSKLASQLAMVEISKDILDEVFQDLEEHGYKAEEKEDNIIISW